MSLDIFRRLLLWDEGEDESVCELFLSAIPQPPQDSQTPLVSKEMFWGLISHIYILQFRSLMWSTILEKILWDLGSFLIVGLCTKGGRVYYKIVSQPLLPSLMSPSCLPNMNSLPPSFKVFFFFFPEYIVPYIGVDLIFVQQVVYTGSF